MPEAGGFLGGEAFRTHSSGCALLGIGRGAAPSRHKMAASEDRCIRVRPHAGGAAGSLMARTRPGGQIYLPHLLGVSPREPRSHPYIPSPPPRTPNTPA